MVSRRTVHLAPSALTILREQQRQREVLRAELALPVRGHAKGYERKRSWGGSELFLTNGHGATLYPDVLNRKMGRLCEKAGVRRLIPLRKIDCVCNVLFRTE